MRTRCPGSALLEFYEVGTNAKIKLVSIQSESDWIETELDFWIAFAGQMGERGGTKLRRRNEDRG